MAGPKPNFERQAEAVRLYDQGWTLQKIANHFGISKSAAFSSLVRAGHSSNNKRPERRKLEACESTTQAPKVFCGQCDRLVLVAEATSCRSQWCKAKEAA